MPKVVDGLSDWVLSQWFATGRVLHVGTGRMTMQ